MNVIELRPQQRRRVIVSYNDHTSRYRVSAFPPCRHGNLDREFRTSGDAVRYAADLGVRHGFPIHSAEVPDREWRLLVLENLAKRGRR
jgi:hypothetical protein